MTLRREDTARSRDPALDFEWIELGGSGRNRSARACKRRWLPPVLASLSAVHHLYPAAIAAPPAWFFATSFTTPSRRNVFKAHPVYICLADRTVVTVSGAEPFGSLRSLVTPLEGTAPSDLLRGVLEAAADSYGGVTDGLNDVFGGGPDRMNPSAWHRKERRLAVFVHLMERHLKLLKHPEVGQSRRRRVDDDLGSLLAITRYTLEKIRAVGMCPVCRRTGLG